MIDPKALVRTTKKPRSRVRIEFPEEVEGKVFQQVPAATKQAAPRWVPPWARSLTPPAAPAGPVPNRVARHPRLAASSLLGTALGAGWGARRALDPAQAPISQVPPARPSVALESEPIRIKAGHTRRLAREALASLNKQAILEEQALYELQAAQVGYEGLGRILLAHGSCGVHTPSRTPEEEKRGGWGDDPGSGQSDPGSAGGSSGSSKCISPPTLLAAAGMQSFDNGTLSTHYVMPPAALSKIAQGQPSAPAPSPAAPPTPPAPPQAAPGQFKPSIVKQIVNPNSQWGVILQNQHPQPAPPPAMVAPSPDPTRPASS